MKILIKYIQYVILITAIFHAILVSPVASQNPTPDSIELYTDGTVHSITQDRERIYVGGQFTKIKIDEHSSVQQQNFAVIDIATRMLTPYQYNVNGVVHDIELDDNNIFIGGEFTLVNDEKRAYVASIDKSSNELTAWNPSVEQPVQDLLLENDQLIVITTTQISDSSAQIYLLNPTTGVVITPTVTIQSLTSTPIPRVTPVSASAQATAEGDVEGLMIEPGALGFKIPTLTDLITFAIRAFFAIAGIAALFIMLLGAFNWVTSGGDKDSITAARERIQAAVVGLIMIVVVLALIWTLEQVIFNRRICLGLSCPLTLPSLIEPVP